MTNLVTNLSELKCYRTSRGTPNGFSRKVHANFVQLVVYGTIYKKNLRLVRNSIP